MKTENPAIQMRKGILEFCVLCIISRGEVYASDLLEELHRAKLMVVDGTLYPLLTRLKNSGLVDYRWVESVSGPPRKYYTLTQTGSEHLALVTTAWTEITEAVALIMHPGMPTAAAPATAPTATEPSGSSQSPENESNSQSDLNTTTNHE